MEHIRDTSKIIQLRVVWTSLGNSQFLLYVWDTIEKIYYIGAVWLDIHDHDAEIGILDYRL